MGQGAHLLNPRNMSGDILDGDRILNGEAMALALHSCLVNKHTSIGGKTWSKQWLDVSSLPYVRQAELTSERETDVVIKHDNLSYRPWIL
jgi:hypothetical protein